MLNNKLISIVVAVLGFWSTSAFAGTFVGEYCWIMQHLDGTDRYFRFAITDMGAGHYAVHGNFMKADLSAKSTVYGSASRIDNAWEISVTRMDSSSGPTTRLRQFHFDLAPNGNGTVRWMWFNDGLTMGMSEAPAILNDCSTQPSP